MTHYTVCCGYASHYHNTVTIEADTLDAALEKAIEQAGDNPHWKSVDQASQTFVEALAEGEDADPWGDTALPVPDRFTEKGEPPVVTLTGLRPPGGIEVSGGAVRIRIIEAEIDLLPMQSGDVKETYADISDMQRDFGFSPKTAIDEGIPSFVAWYRDYHGD